MKMNDLRSFCSQLAVFLYMKNSILEAFLLYYVGSLKEILISIWMQ